MTSYEAILTKMGSHLDSRRLGAGRSAPVTVGGLSLLPKALVWIRRLQSPACMFLIGGPEHSWKLLLWFGWLLSVGSLSLAILAFLIACKMGP